MQTLKKYISLIIMVLLLAPSFVQLAHIINEEHETSGICISKDQQQFQELELDCEICTFQLHSFISNEIPRLAKIKFQQITTFSSLYTSFESNSLLAITLRGPPSWV